MAQQIINTGAVANDGTGDPLRTAFTETNNNFTEIYTAGPVDSNVRIANNTVLTLNTNGNLVLAPNGTGRVVANVDIVPNQANVRNLGGSARRWSTLYLQYADISNTVTVGGGLTVGGNLTVSGNIIQVGNIITDSLTIQLGNTAANAAAANGAGITVGASDNIATLLYNSTGNVWTTNIGVSAVGNISAPYFVGDGSQLTNISVGNSGAVQFNWQGSLSNQGGTPGDTYSTLQFDSNGMPTLDGTTAYQQRVDYSPYLQVLAPRVESTDFGIVAGPAIQITGYADDVFYNTPRSAYLSVQDQATATQQWDFGILGNGSNNYSISDRTNSNQWTFGTDGDLSAPGNVTAGNVLTSAQVVASGVIQTGTGFSTGGYLSVNGSTDLHDTNIIGNLSVNVIRSDDSTVVLIKDGVEIDGDAVVNGNVTADYFVGNGSQLTGLPASYSNSNVTTLLSNLGSNVISGTGNITTTANISGAYILGNGSVLTSLPAPTVTQDITSNGAMSIMTYDGVIKYVNYATVEPSSGNIAGGNITTTGLVSATGNITSGNISTGKITLTNGAVIRDTAGDAVAFGQDAGLTNQGLVAVAIGNSAGNVNQGNISVAIGYQAGNTSQGDQSVAIGDSAGKTTQGE